MNARLLILNVLLVAPRPSQDGLHIADKLANRLYVHQLDFFKEGFMKALVYRGPGKIHPKKLITHHFALKDLIKAFETFGSAMKEQALKVIISNN